MAGTGVTSKADENTVNTDTENKQSAPSVETRKYFLPETGQVVDAPNAVEAAKQANKGNNEG